MATVGCEDCFHGLALREIHQAGVCQVESLIGVPGEYVRDAREIVRAKRQQNDSARVDSAEQRLHDVGPIAEQVGRFRDDRPRRAKRAAERASRCNANRVMLIPFA